MPELPEVETIARALEPGLVGRRITGADVPDVKVLATPKTKAAFHKQVAGREITAVRRRAKLLLLQLGPRPEPPDDGPAILAMHLKMTGRFHIARQGEIDAPYARLVLALSDGNALVFSDMRRFGTARLLAPEALAGWDFYASLGPEPWDMTPDAFRAALGRRCCPVKAALLDQKVIAGIGNIYADESLFAARIRPEHRANDLAAPQCRALLDAVQAVITRAIAARGSTIRDYRTPDGVEGGFQRQFCVYGKAGEACPVCGAKLVAVKVAGRTSTFCPRCQK